MPNWCENDVLIRGSKHDVNEYIEKYTTDGSMDFDKIVPMPKEYLDDERWYNWRVENWGTKWNIDKESGNWDFHGDDDVSIVEGTFETAWSPPMEALHKLSELCPNLEIELTFSEEGMQFQGKYIFSAGATEEVYYRTGDDFISPWGDDEDDDE